MIPRVAAIKVGPTTSLENFLGPVINEDAVKKILGYIDIGKREGRLLTGGTRLPREGFFVAPTVIADIAPDAVIAQDEIFGPVLAVVRARDYYHALEIANNTQYGLTGAVYTRSRREDQSRQGGLPRRQSVLQSEVHGLPGRRAPLWRIQLSGTDSKAGGRDYLLLFLQAKSIAEKVGRGDAGEEARQRPRRGGKP